MRALLLATIASVSLIGCVGELDGGMTGGGGDDSTVGPGTNPNPNPDSQARKKFEENVYPIIKSTGVADCSSCHNAAGPAGNVTGFVAPDLADAYATVTSYQTVVGNFAPNAAGILTKIAAGHQGRTYSQAQIDSITDWLNTEVSERATGGTGTGTGTGTSNETYSAATARVLNNWSACMSLTNFNTANMAQAWGQMQTNNGERCAACHSTGGYGFMATGIAETKAGGPPGLFTTMATNQYYLVMYYSVDLSDTTRDATGKLMNAKMKLNEDSFKGVAQNIAPHVQHPSFNYTNSQGINALKTFYTSTAAAVAAGNCGTTKLDPPAQ
jgi:mono/diheme cytochrome c family protein